MEFKIKGTISGTHFDRKKVGDADKTVGSFKIEFIKGENRTVDYSAFLDLIDDGRVSIVLQYFGKDQQNAFDRVNLEAELKDMKDDPKLAANKVVMPSIIETWKKRAELSVTELKSAINEIKNRLDGDKAQRERMEKIPNGIGYQKCAPAQKAYNALVARDKKKRLTSDELEDGLDNIEEIIAKHDEGGAKKKKSVQTTLKPLQKGGSVPAGAN
jgi:hypothetical protein